MNCIEDMRHAHFTEGLVLFHVLQPMRLRPLLRGSDGARRHANERIAPVLSRASYAVAVAG